ncbi:serine hydrolase domain-containing protein [Sphingosinicella rhizophila]|uniref:Serine hydrolase domain-containing protein n=1 Tax=Sphingosinicella rhizophila TaxID=3050082 RepID=A0ABU3QBG7_9SPHN|nr:serine hydrolase domain-containing protein [Sphingosinicella sp. GR2756]MDT9600721.1 serine hydrolase domain-containing protein [Sphingosinicella sp. GR2756]
MKREANKRPACPKRLWGLLLAALAAPAVAAPQPSTPPALASKLPVTRSGSDAAFAAIAARHFLAPLARRQIGGGVIVAVKDGRQIYRAAIGYADRERRLAVDADRTMFNIASISKTFTATAVAQLVTQGRLDYDDPIDRRLRNLAPRLASSRQIRVGELLSHRSGIPDRFLGGSCRGPDCRSLAVFLRERLPAQRVPSGRFVSYANTGSSVAGLMVADITGSSFGDYLRRHIFAPAGMAHSRFDFPGEPPAAAGDAFPALAYEADGRNRLVRSPPYFSVFSPAGQVAASGADMGRYMIAHLESGSPLLPDGARRDMQVLHGRTPGLAEGFGWGWDVRAANGARIIGHGGDLRGIVSDLRMIPSQRIGYFAAVTGDAGPVLEEMRAAFVDHYAGTVSFRPALPAPGVQVDPDLAGTYQDFRFTAPDQLKMLSMFSETHVRRLSATEISVELPPQIGGGTYRFAPIGRDLYRITKAPDGRRAVPDTMLSLLRDEHGSIRFIALNVNGYSLAAERMPFYARMNVKLPVLGFCLLALLVGTLAVAVGSFRARRAPWPAAVLILSCACLSAFVAWVAFRLANASPWDLLYGIDALGLAPAYLLLWIATAGFPIAAVLHFGRAARSLPIWERRAHLMAVSAGLAASLLFALNGQFHGLY